MTDKSVVSPLQDHERQRCEVWTRVMGYHRPVSEFNPGKQAEHGERRHFAEPGRERTAHA
ncbi:MAG: oxidoreductase [Dechloromonas agitata]|uniref:Oxidoreductase n=1 Tax=Dechloromonas agitata TaxID=73030 RepID=A0A930BQ41_9RHOO|nr:oxidoreductase [Dechloromonas agitata]